MEASGSVSFGNIDPPEEKAPEEPNEEAPIKEKKIRLTFSEDHLIRKEGLWKIYNDFPHKVKFKGKGHEAEYVRTLISCYGDWAFRLYPKAGLEDVVFRTSKLGSRKRVRDTVENIRQAERERVLRAKLGDEDYESIVSAKEADKKEEEERRNAEKEPTAAAGAAALIEERIGAGSAGDSSDSEDETPKAQPDEQARKAQELKERMERNRQLALQKLQQRRAAANHPPQTQPPPPSSSGNNNTEEDAMIEDYLAAQDMAPSHEVDFYPEDDFAAEMEAMEEMEQMERQSQSKQAPNRQESPSQKAPVANQHNLKESDPDPAETVFNDHLDGAEKPSPELPAQKASENNGDQTLKELDPNPAETISKEESDGAEKASPELPAQKAPKENDDQSLKESDQNPAETVSNEHSDGAEKALPELPAQKAPEDNDDQTLKESEPYQAEKNSNEDFDGTEKASPETVTNETVNNDQTLEESSQDVAEIETKQDESIVDKETGLHKNNYLDKEETSKGSETAAIQKLSQDKTEINQAEGDGSKKRKQLPKGAIGVQEFAKKFMPYTGDIA